MSNNANYPTLPNGYVVEVKDSNELLKHGYSIIGVNGKLVYQKTNFSLIIKNTNDNIQVETSRFEVKRTFSNDPNSNDQINLAKVEAIKNKFGNQQITISGLTGLEEDDPRVQKAIKDHSDIDLTQDEKNSLTHVYSSKATIKKPGKWWWSSYNYQDIRFLITIDGVTVEGKIQLNSN